jgi:hypothetical protein
MATLAQRKARDVNFAIFRVKGARELFLELAERYHIPETKEAISICNEMVRKLRRVR